jgi:hypothetical protein
MKATGTRRRSIAALARLAEETQSMEVVGPPLGHSPPA